jgi:spore coat polysaccharide biosynthesis protein SpsF (cytidylyltransferase family)
MSIGIILQARMGSLRLPGKMLMDINGITLLNRCLSIMKRASDTGAKLYLATTNLDEDKILLSKSQDPEIIGFSGHPTDLIERFTAIAIRDNLEIICRLTGDNPFIDHEFLKYSIENIRSQNSQIPTIVTSRGGTLAQGLDVEVFNICALRRARLLSRNYDREHVTSGMVENNGFREIRIKGKQIHKEFNRLTVDYSKDLEIAQKYALKFDLEQRSVRDFGIRKK